MRRWLLLPLIAGTPVPTCHDGRTFQVAELLLQPPPLPLQPVSVIRVPFWAFTFATVPPTESTSGSRSGQLNGSMLVPLSPLAAMYVMPCALIETCEV